MVKCPFIKPDSDFSILPSPPVSTAFTLLFMFAPGLVSPLEMGTVDLMFGVIEAVRPGNLSGNVPAAGYIRD